MGAEPVRQSGALPCGRPSGERPVAVANAEASAALFAGLAARCRDLVMSPGSRNTPLILAARARADLRVHVVLDERAAAFVALGLARQQGRPVVLLCTSGSAGAHYLPAICEAERSRLPLVALTADRPPELHACGAPQTMEQSGLFSGHVRHARSLFGLDLPGWRHAGLVAVDEAAGPPAGPVHLNVALREPLWLPGVSASPPAPEPAAMVGRRTLGQDQLQQLARRLSGVPRGVVFCGARRGEGAIGAAAAALCDAAGWPLLAEASSGCRIGAHAAGGHVIAAYEAIVATGLLPPPQVAVQVGAAPLSKPLLRWLSGAGHVMRLDERGQRDDPALAGGSLLVADPADTMQALAGRVVAAESTWLPTWRAAENAAQLAIGGASEALFEVGVARHLVSGLARGVPLLVGASMPSRDVDAFAPCGEAGPQIHGNRGLNGIDGAVATAAGHALAGGHGALLCGDLTLRHDLGGLLAARSLGVPLDVVVIDNGGGGIFAELPIVDHPEEFEASFLTPQAAPLAELCRGTGAEVVEVGSMASLRAWLRRPARGIRIAIVTVDRAASAAHRRQTRLRAAAAARTVLEQAGHLPALPVAMPTTENR